MFCTIQYEMIFIINPLLFPIIISVAFITLRFLFRILKMAIFKEGFDKGNTEDNISLLFVFIGLFWFVYQVYPSESQSKKAIIYIFIPLCILGIVCGIIQNELISLQSGKVFLEDAMKSVVRLIDSIRAFTIWSKQNSLPFIAMFVVLLFVIGIAIVLCPNTRGLLWVLMAMIACIFLFIYLLQRCLHSCGYLLWFFLGHTFIITFCLMLVVTGRAELENGPFWYCFVCFALAFFWSIGAGVSDYDVAKMAGAIINSITTILLVAVNIFSEWVQRVDFLSSIFTSAKIMYGLNLVIFPFVVSGYLAMLFVDGIEYARKKFDIPEGPR